MTRKLQWTAHPGIAEHAEAPPYTARKADGVPLKIELMHLLDMKLGDKPMAGCSDSIYVYLSAFGPRSTTRQDRFGFMSEDTVNLAQDWNCFTSVKIYENRVARFDPQPGPMDTPEQRLAAVLRSYPVVVECLKTYADSIFDEYVVPEFASIDIDAAIAEAGETDPEAFVVGGDSKVVITAPGNPDIVLPFTGLNRRDAAERAIDTARHHGAVTLAFNGATVTVNEGDTVDDVANEIRDQLTAAAP